MMNLTIYNGSLQSNIGGTIKLTDVSVICTLTQCLDHMTPTEALCCLIVKYGGTKPLRAVLDEHDAKLAAEKAENDAVSVLEVAERR